MARLRVEHNPEQETTEAQSEPFVVFVNDNSKPRYRPHQGPEHCAGLNVVDGSMPRAGDLLARHLALRERAATVRAGIVNGVEVALDVEEGELLPRHLDALRLARSEVGGARDLDELRHVNLLFRSELDHTPPATIKEPPRIRLCQNVSLPKAAEFPITSRSMYWMNRGAVVRRCCHSAFDDDETKSGFQRGRVK